MKLKEIIEANAYDEYWDNVSKEEGDRRHQELVKRMSGMDDKNESDDEEYELALDIVEEYTHDFQTTGNLDAAVGVLMDYGFVYEGQMVRGFFISNDEITSQDPKAILKNIHTKSNKAEFENMSWSKSVNGMKVALHSNMKAGFYDHMNLDNVGVVVVSQTHEALDVSAALGKKRTFNPKEEELLAPLDNKATIVDIVAARRLVK